MSKLWNIPLFHFEGKKPELPRVCYITIEVLRIYYVILYNTIVVFHALL